MKRLTAAAPKLAELEAMCASAQAYVREHAQPIKGIRTTVIRVVHAHGEWGGYADAKYPCTALIPMELIVPLPSVVAAYQQIKKLFKNTGVAKYHWHAKGMVLTVGFEIDATRMAIMEDLFS